jgi:hypothetical protein
MAQEVGTFSTYDSVGNREELADTIMNIDPEDTPFISMIGKRKVATKHPEWQKDNLANPDTTNAKVEGYEYAYLAHNPTVRVGNYTQISDKTVMVTETEEVVDKAGRKSEMAYQIAKKGKELRMDMEAISLSNQASVAGSDSVARKLGGFPAWLTTNDQRGTGGADGGFNTGTGLVDAATNGAQRAFTKAMLDAALTQSYTAGGNIDAVMLTPYNKRVFSSFMSDPSVAAQRTNTRGTEQATIVGAADYYVSDFGGVGMVPNRIMAKSAATARNILGIDRDAVALGTLRPIQKDDPAKTGDNLKKVIKTEWTLIVDTEAAHFVIADTFGLTATT